MEGRPGRRRRWLQVLALALLLVAMSRIVALTSFSPASPSPPRQALGSLFDVRGAIHVHTQLSHDGRAEVDEIVTAPGLDERKYIGPLADAYDRIDPSKDGWESEALGAEASSQLGVLAKLIAEPDQLTAEKLSDLAAADFRCEPLRQKCCPTKFRFRSP